MKRMMERSVRQSICNELRDKYEEVDLLPLFIEDDKNGSGLTSLERWEFKQKVIESSLSGQNKYTTKIKPNSFQTEYRVCPEYHKEIDVSFNRFVNALFRYGILVTPSRGKYEMAKFDDPVFESERDGISIKCKMLGPDTVYQRRMNTSGSIDTTVNGQPAERGVTAQDPLEW